ncbi:hypothetical protein TrLO_g4801 [Triparma laevis f. longispina]|uniref:Uncharacterized protein n=2 Tax=Triparma laevis TaxID=1534972 RepID=A0A9W7KWQ2_9STRA|nr:hypothetical protein TrLO_g4801 [Triparma laevis f. longispina]
MDTTQTQRSPTSVGLNNRSLDTTLTDAASRDYALDNRSSGRSDDSEQFKIKDLDTGKVVMDVRESPSRKRSSLDGEMIARAQKFTKHEANTSPEGNTNVNTGSIVGSPHSSRASSEFSTSTMEIRSLKAQLKRKDKYILHLAKTLRAEKQQSSSSLHHRRGGSFTVNPLTPRSRTPPSRQKLCILMFLSILVASTLLMIAPHFSIGGLCAPYRRGGKAEVGFKKGPWITGGDFADVLCGDNAVSFNFTPPVLMVMTASGDYKFNNVAEFVMGARGVGGSILKQRRWMSLSYIRWGRKTKNISWKKKGQKDFGQMMLSEWF